MENKFVKASELLVKEEFANKLKSAENDADVQKLFADAGVELTLEDIVAMCEESAKIHADGELDESALDSVSGGFILSTTACFVWAAAELAFFTGYGYKAIKKK